MAVRLLLLLDDGHVPDAELLRELSDAFESRAVERRIDELQIRNAVAAADALGIDGVYERVQHLVRDIPDAAGGERGVKVLCSCGREIVHLLQQRDHALGGLGRHLAAVGTIDLVAVVGRGVVAGRHADAKAAVQMPHGKAQGRDRLEPGIEIRRDAVGSEDRCSLPGENVTLDAAVMADGDGLRQVRLVEIVGDRLRRAADDVDIHPVRARAQNAAQTGRAELQIAVKGVSDLVRVVLHGGKLLPQLRVQRLLRTPVLISLFRKFHICIPPANCFFVLYHSLYIVATGRKRADGCLRVLCYA